MTELVDAPLPGPGLFPGPHLFPGRMRMGREIHVDEKRAAVLEDGSLAVRVRPPRGVAQKQTLRYLFELTTAEETWSAEIAAAVPSARPTLRSRTPGLMRLRWTFKEAEKALGPIGTPGAVSQVLRRLEANGLVLCSEPSPGRARRTTWVMLTEAGRRIAAGLPTVEALTDERMRRTLNKNAKR